MKKTTSQTQTQTKPKIITEKSMTLFFAMPKRGARLTAIKIPASVVIANATPQLRNSKKPILNRTGSIF